MCLVASSCCVSAGVTEGKAAYDAKDYKTAFAEFSKDQKNSDAMAWIGLLYENGYGVKQDPKIAAKWMEKAAKAGQMWAANRLADYYINGSGVKKDPPLAFQWQKKAVDGGRSEAVAQLGRMYREGYGTAKDGAKAIELFKIGADANDVESMTELGNAYSDGEIVEKDLAVARNWLEKAFDAGGRNSVAFSLGLMYANGQGGAKNLQKAVSYYTKAAESGHAGAQNNLGLAYWDGSGVAKNVTSAEKWLKLSSDNGNTKAASNYKLLQDEIRAAQAALAEETAARDRVANAKRAPGTKLCNRGSGQYQEYQGVYILGNPYFKLVNGSYTLMAFVERSVPPKLSLRVARIDFTTMDRRSINLTSWDDPNWGQLSPGSVFWSEEYVWELC